MTQPRAAHTRAILQMEITPATKLVLLDLVHLVDADGVAQVSPRQVAERTQLTTRGVYKSLAALAEAGYATDESADDTSVAVSRPWRLHLDRISRPVNA